MGMTPLKLARIKGRSSAQMKQALGLLEGRILEEQAERIKEHDELDVNRDGIITDEERRCRELAIQLLQLVRKLSPLYYYTASYILLYY